VRAIEDERLVEVLAERRIALGVCPSSNLTLGLYPSLAEHPIERLRQAGVPVSVNTDDPALLRLSLPEEYAKTAAAFGWDDETVRALARVSVEASFAPASTKAAILRDLAAW
jgi:adenosine deaminase